MALGDVNVMHARIAAYAEGSQVCNINMRRELFVFASTFCVGKKTKATLCMAMGCSLNQEKVPLVRSCQPRTRVKWKIYVESNFLSPMADIGNSNLIWNKSYQQFKANFFYKVMKFIQCN